MMKQLTAMVAKMGDLGGAAEVAATQSAGTEDEGEGIGGMEGGNNGRVRPVVKAIGTNVSDLVEVLCGPANAPLFLKFGADDPSTTNNEESNENEDATMDNEKSNEEPPIHKIDATKEAGGLSTLLLHCATNLPLQTPSYAALTLGVDVKAPKETHAGFAKRCVELGMRTFGRDLDLALECAIGGSAGGGGGNGGDGEGNNNLSEEEQVAILKSKEDQRCFAESHGGIGNGTQIDAYHRIKLLLRYFAHLATIGIVPLGGDGGEEEGSLMGLLGTLVEAASRAAHTAAQQGGKDEKSRALARAAQLLASLVLSTVPYLLQLSEVNDNNSVLLHRLSEMVDALENNVIGHSSAGYSSEYDPGCGPMSILLKGELDDAPVGSMEEEEDDEDDDDDEEEDDGPAPCADTLQDLLRTVRKLIDASNDSNSASTRFALLDDAPWNALTMPDPSSSAAGMEGMEVEAGVEMVSMSYKGEPLLLDIIGGEEQRCKSIPYLMNIDNYNGEESIDIRCRSLDGIVYGRLAIFDAPPNPDDSDDEEEEAKETNPNLECYIKTYSLTDRYFLSDAVRDVLACHRPMVSDAGAERNTAKEVAEQIWAVSHLFKSPAPVEGGSEESSAAALVPSLGIEYGIVETLLSLIVQCTPMGSNMPSSSPVNSHLYLSRVVLELTKLQPSLIPQAIVLAISGMFQDFIPSLTPTARTNLSVWLGFHLVNTEYQWPKAYWDHWAPCAATTAGTNSRGEFIKVALWNMAAMSSEGAVAVVKECLPAGSTLVQSVFLNGGEDNGGEVSATEKDLINRLWNTAEDPDNIRHFMISDELAESYGSTGILDNTENSMYHKSVWWRARLAARALFHPIKQESLRIARITENAAKQSSAAGGEMDDDANVMDEVDESEDLIADMSDAISRFKPVVLAALARDADAYDSIASGRVDDDELLLAGETSLLKEVGSIIPRWDLNTFTTLMECLLNDRIISGMSLATWALREYDTGGVVGTNWWKVVSLAIRYAIRDAVSKLEASKTDLGGGIGMIVDNDGQTDEDPMETAALRLDEALKATVPILKYVTERACHVLASSASEKKIPLMGADIAEGMKRLLMAVLFHFHSNVLSSPSGGAGILTAANVQKGFASMDADGEKLASLCVAAIDSCQGEQCKKLLRSLALSLEKLL